MKSLILKKLLVINILNILKQLLFNKINQIFSLISNVINMLIMNNKLLMNLYYIMLNKYLYRYQIIKKLILVYFINKTKIMIYMLRYVIRMLTINNKKFLLLNQDQNYVYKFQIKNKQKLSINILNHNKL